MKSKFLLVTLPLFMFSIGSVGQTMSFEIDTIAIHTGSYSDGVDLTGKITYRIYAVCPNMESVITQPIANWSIGFIVSSINSTTSFWQSPVGGNAASSIDCSLIIDNPSLSFDSWVTIGCESGCDCAVPITTQGGIYGSWIPAFENGGDISISSDWEGGSGNWSVSATAVQAVAGSDMRILIGQFTTDGEVCINMMMRMYTDGYVDTSSQAEYPIGSMCNDGDYLLGCTDPPSCNYDENADGNDGTCIFSGCMDPAACNYSANAGCESGTCYYPSIASGFIYHDVNGNGLWGGLSAEPKIGSTGSLHIAELDLTVFPGINGEFDFGNIPLGDYTLSYTDVNGIWDTSNDEWSATLPVCTALRIGVNSEFDSLIQVVNPINDWGQNLHCTDGMNIGIQIQNIGTEDLYGSFTVAIPDGLSISNVPGSVAYSSFVNGIVSWIVDDQEQGEALFYQIHIEGPGAEFFGDSFDFPMQLLLNDINDLNYYNGSWVIQAVVTCAYDPNDKLSLPVGFTDQHFILAQDEIEYKIRFQNTGNLPAQDVIIADSLDIAHLDQSTFHMVMASHQSSTVLDSEGHIQFIFNNIYLPDSGSNESGSHGFVVYRIKPLPTVQGWDEIHNTAYIYFDSNPAIVTNTTMHTIYDCDWLTQLPEYDNICPGVYSTLEFDAPYVESYAWSVNGEPIAETTSTITLDLIETGDYILELTRSNELCSGTANMTIHVHPNPEPEITYDANTGIVNAPEGYNYAWYLFDELMLNENESSFDPWQYVADGISVYVIVTDEWGCSGTSNIIVNISTPELPAIRLGLFPNPVEENTRLVLPAGNFHVVLYNAIGQKMEEWNNEQNSLEISSENLSSGAYMLNAINEEGKSSQVIMLVR